MLDPASTSAAVKAGAAIFVLLGALVYRHQITAVLRDGGKVGGGGFGLPELLMSVVFAGYFAMLPIAAALHPEAGATDLSIDKVLPSSLIFIVFTGSIAGFLAYRGLPLGQTLGLGRVPILAVVGWACGLVLAAFPLSIAANVLTVLVLRSAPEPQPLVDLFAKVARSHDSGALGRIALAAVLIQPICEEFLFRGFFYGVWKRYLGPVGGGILACLLFAAVHASLSAFAGLFVLAVCLNIAYERTGSLLVPTLMHALFNFASLLLIYVQAHWSKAA